MANKRSPKSAAEGIPLLEWITGGIGAIIVAAALGFLIYEGVAGDSTPPDVTVEVREIKPVRDGFRVRFEARNQGGDAAAEVVIRGELTTDGTTIEASEASIDYLPPHSARGGGLFFARDPAGSELKVRARSYEEP